MLRYLLFGCFVAYVTAFSTGAPNGACGNLRPQHGADSKPNPGYAIDVIPGSPVNVALGAGGRQFKGYLIQAFQNVNGRSVAVGKFRDANGSQVTCGGTGITHVDASTPVTQVNLQWDPPAGGATVFFRATVVENFSDIYENIVSGEFTF